MSERPAWVRQGAVWVPVLLAVAIALEGCQAQPSSPPSSSAATPTVAPQPAGAQPSGAATGQVGSSPVGGRLPDVPFARGDAKRGEELFGRVGCIGCHTARGVGGAIGPDLTEVATRAPQRATAVGLARPELYFVQSIVYPQAYVVEGFVPVMLDWKQLQLDEQNLADLVAFLSTLKEP